MRRRKRLMILSSSLSREANRQPAGHGFRAVVSRLGPTIRSEETPLGHLRIRLLRNPSVRKPLRAALSRSRTQSAVLFATSNRGIALVGVQNPES